MKDPKILLKPATVASSLLLVAAFVAYHAGAFDRLTGAGPQPVDTRSDPPLTVAGQQGDNLTSSDISQSERTVEPAPSQEPPSATQQAPTLMSGTKSFSPRGYLQGLQPATPEHKSEPVNPRRPLPNTGTMRTPPALMGDTKTGVILPPVIIP